MKLAVVQSCYGGIDSLLDSPRQSVEPDEWVMVTDGDIHPETHRHVMQPRPWMHPRLAAKHAKMQPFDYVDADVAIWLDTGAVIKSEHLIETGLEVLGDADMALWQHPERGNIHDEATCSAAMGKYDGQHTRQQAAHYIAQGLPPGLWATGFIVWRNSERTRRMGAHWLAECVRWSMQDQLSFPYVAWMHDVDVNAMPQSLWRNSHVTWRGHN